MTDRRTFAILVAFATDENDLKTDILHQKLEKNPLCPAFSEAAAIGFDPEKGRTVTARRDIKVNIFLD